MIQPSCKRLSRSTWKARRGATILIVLVLISITLAFSFAMIRTQAVSSQVQQNYDRRAAAKQAAMAGLSIGLRKMSEASWAGVDVDISGNLSADSSYHITYETGDPNLGPGDPDAAEYPYRVTVTSTGTSIALGAPSQQSTHTIRAVMQLIRRRMEPVPAAWTQAQPYTLYQWHNGAGRPFECELPVRIEGPLAIQNAIELCEEYPSVGEGETFAGVLDEVTILGSALAPSLIEQLANGQLDLDDVIGEASNVPVGAWKFNENVGSEVAHDELNLNRGIYDGAQPGAVSDTGSGAAIFDGLNDQVFLGAVGVYTGKITILARLNVAEFHNSMQIVCSSTSNTTYWALGIDGPERRLRFSIRSVLGDFEVLTSSKDVLAVDQWVDVAAVYSGTTLKLFVNGVPVGEKSRLGYLASTPSANLSIGSRPPGSARARYLRDLRHLATAGGPDERPFDGPLTLNRGMVAGSTQNLLEEDLGLTVNEIALPAGPPVANPGQISQYQLYPGGKVYTVPQLARGSIRNTQLGPDLQANPLGLFVCTDELRLYDNVTISGTVLTYRGSTAGDLRIAGNNVSLQAVDLPRLDGATETWQLPVAIVNNDFEIDSNSSGSLTGAAVTWDDFRFRPGTTASNFTVNGKLIVSEIQLRRRFEWDQGSNWWNNRMSEFMRSIDWQNPANSRFPTWLAANHSLNSLPLFQARPAAAARQYHWHDWSQPLFSAHPNDQGLRWDLVDWRDRP